MKAQIAIAALAVLLAIGSADATECRYATCPDGYQSTYVGGLKCPTCYWPMTLQCGSLLSEPYCCGGDTGITCPTISCTTSSSYAISGSFGCAKAASTIKALAVSNTTIDFADDYAAVLKSYCVDGGADEQLAAFTQLALKVYVDSIATVLADYSIFVCDCGNCRTKYTGCNAAYSEVTADMQAVAIAQAYAAVEAVARVKDACFSNPALLAAARGYAESFAQATELAIKQVWDSAITMPGKDTCKQACTQQVMKTAIAKAVACVWAKVFVSARDNCNPETAYSCSATVALAGDAADNWAVECPITGPCNLPPPPAVHRRML